MTYMTMAYATVFLLLTGRLQFGSHGVFLVVAVNRRESMCYQIRDMSGLRNPVAPSYAQ